MRTRLATQIGIDVPVIQGPMAGGATTPELVSAVSNAGALGSLGAAMLSPSDLREAIRAVRARTARPFNVNLLVPTPEDPRLGAAAAMVKRLGAYHKELGLDAPALPDKAAEDFHAQMQVIIEEKVPVFSFAFAIPEPALLAGIKASGAKVLGTATTVAEARALVEAGVDVVVAQGSEAGGHRGTFLAEFDDAMIGVMTLVPQIIDAVDVPVVAAGGIMDGRGIAAALALGAAAAQMGTAFLTCPESGIPVSYKEAIPKAEAEQTEVTRAFSGRPARGIRNRFMVDLRETGAAIPPYPIQNALTRRLRAEAAKRGLTDFMSMWVGQGARLARPLPAAELVGLLAAETETSLRRFA